MQGIGRTSYPMMDRTMAQHFRKKITPRRTDKDISRVLRGAVCVVGGQLASVVLLLGLIIITV